MWQPAKLNQRIVGCTNITDKQLIQMAKKLSLSKTLFLLLALFKTNVHVGLIVLN